ncbi:GntR family transcriptional regulator [Prosthecochloris marina]|uniref:GntR family transcriptional regulator n=2 Tax=Prosthecochloris marina TaxID=2017681 RepID=A0A317T9T1_9CHLB|nr:PLP-dependent aminotransferase family protein [Prosthecochloris marina]PWW83365.1 GntR family transcriptional regulator [Prosthecochloris marina]
MPRFSSSISSLRSSEIRDLMKLVTRPGIISFAGGMPDNDLFPISEVDELFGRLDVLKKQQAFQYGPTPGLPSLLESLGEFLAARGLPTERERLMITTGSQQAISILARAFLDPGDRVLVENPCFIGALSAFKSCQAELTGLSVDKEGISIGDLDVEANSTDPAKLLYITPYFHNPGGILYSMERKRRLVETLAWKDIVLIEDDAYGELYFYEEDKPHLKPIKAENPEGLDVCYTGSFSKILGPGLRLGWLLASEEIYERCELIKQSYDACSPSFTQVIADEFIRSGQIFPYMERVRTEYRKRALLMGDILEATLPTDVAWTRPRGGFYIWLALPEHIDASEVLELSLEDGVVFVIGKTFDPQGRRNNTLRLSYCNTDASQIERGIPIIASAIKKVMNRY